MDVPNVLEERDAEVAGAESIDNPRVGYESQEMGNGTIGNADGSIRSHPMYGFNADITQVEGNFRADQLTVSFRGEVYVFDAVSPDKAVLLLLGGYEESSGLPLSITSPNNTGMSEGSGKLSQPQRAASLNRFREKKKERCFHKRIRYNIRKEVALRMQRKKGQFTSSKTVSDEVGSASPDSNATQSSEHDVNIPETLCTHCGASSKSSPMMRRGPEGPKTLCNACGLKWANKGVLRRLPRAQVLENVYPSVTTSELAMTQVSPR